VAKVTRDSLMGKFARLHSGYGFEFHKGYPTADHIHALGRLGPLPLHRRSFAPVWMAGGVQQQLGLWADWSEGDARLGG
jgi:ribonuclease HII